MAMTISDLPVDLLREIVRRVPLTDMRAVRLTCKKWDTLSKSESFRKMHMCNVSGMVALMDHTLHLIDVVLDDVDLPSTEIKGKLSCLDQQQVKIIKIFHCDGLLLCVLKDSFRLIVWNPYLGQTKWIEPPSYSFRWKRDGWDRYRYALGYDHNKKSHKILRFMDNHIYKEGYFLYYDLYDFDSNLWRTLDVVGAPYDWLILFYEIGVPLRGNTYWLATLKNSAFLVCDLLVCFDFTSETFGPPLPLPFIPEEGREECAVLSCLKGDKLALVLHFHRPFKFEIWATTAIDPTKVSWSKFLAVDTGPVFSNRFVFSSMGLFIDEDKKVAVVFDKLSDTRHTLNIIGEAGFFREVNLPVEYPRLPVNPDYTRLCSHYTPSLVQIRKPPLRVYKRRKQSSMLRLRPCDQNKSRLDDDEEHTPKRTRLT